MTRRPFLLLTTRPEADEARAEHRAFLRAGGFDSPSGLVHLRVPEDDLPSSRELTTDFAGVFLGGSPYEFTTPVEEQSERQNIVTRRLTETLRAILDADHPFFGACHGAGMLTVVLGGAMGTNGAESTSLVPLHRTDAGRADPLVSLLPDTFSAIVGHKEAVATLPRDVELLLRGDACPVQLIRYGTNVYGSQYHPELDHSALRQRMEVYRNYGYFTPDTFNAILAEAERHDLTASGSILLSFVRRYA